MQKRRQKKTTEEKSHSISNEKDIEFSLDNYFDSFRVIDEIRNFKRFSYNWMMKRKRQCENNAFEKFRKNEKYSHNTHV